MLVVVPVIYHETVWLLPAVQFSPPFGADTVKVGGVTTTGALIVKLELLVSSVRMLAFESSARTRIRACVVAKVLEIVQGQLRSPGEKTPLGVRSVE